MSTRSYESRDSFRPNGGKGGRRLVSQAQAPGKLYLAGEYAVVETGHPALLVAVDRFLTVRVFDAESARTPASASVTATSDTGSDWQTGRIESLQHPQASTGWHRERGVLTADTPSSESAYLLAAITTVEALAAQQGMAMRCFDLEVSSDLDAQSGHKYGLGSSAAVCVATVSALLDFYGLVLEPLETYKLVYLASGRAQNLGSGGDLAASFYGGCIRFCSPDRAWVREALEGGVPISQLISKPWPGLSISRIKAFDVFSPLRLLVGWTGSPASTPSLVAQVREGSGQGNETTYQEFLAQSDAAVDSLAQALSQADMILVTEAMAQARSLLRSLSTLTDTPIETPALQVLVESALVAGAAAKSSGAGGGDCGIAIIGPEASDRRGWQSSGPQASLEAQAQAIGQSWTRQGIKPLGLNVVMPLAEVEVWPLVNGVDDGTADSSGSPQADTSGAGQTEGHVVSEAVADSLLAPGSADDNPDSRRKNDHIRLALDQQAHYKPNGFDDLRFVHHSLAAVDPSQVDLSTSVCGADWHVPIYINAMTGGSAQAARINVGLARAAQATGIAMATGSQHAAIRHPQLTSTFTPIRQELTGFIFANVGPTVTPAQARQAVEMLDADALQIHVNPVQEMVMPEGDREFNSWIDRIGQIAQESPVPVVVKEVGFGLSRKTLELLASVGIHTVDLSGRGGTDFAQIENQRRERRDYWYMGGWGQSTALCLLDAGYPTPAGPAILASGGVRSPLDVVKALALGAQAVGVSGHFLRTFTQEGEGGLVVEIRNWIDQIRALMALLGASAVTNLSRTDLLVLGQTGQEARLLGVDLEALARRA
ncbi:type 2 isopentenyl-diphosphate Delta-isomerase [Bifidobacterium aemilianum]|uniref:Isopentenyl-diphosphate delta-isomerase n=1 Tax=Bifidobacterium aemilianum TaxID=2493120 RepID=A0A366KB78_9BIFI|nr:type 2 isopentenyl-diphosphate Delta-isomerase [Bifidobacterium aemilianum]RBP97911.1 type 2 isopentenyl-diphosphate Delta-isomerase [Bifidobacterium aemilianum]